MKLLYIFLALILFGCTSVATESTSRSYSDTSNFDSNASIGDINDYVVIPLSDLYDQVKFMEYESNGVNIRYFVVLGSDGQPRTAFDACDVCGGSKGYEQLGDDIKCRNCGREFSIDGLGSKNKGYGCWPSYLGHRIDEDNLLIKKSDIIGGRSRFV